MFSLFGEHLQSKDVLWRCSLESENEMLEFLSNFTSFDFIHDVNQASGYLIHHQISDDVTVEDLLVNFWYA